MQKKTMCNIGFSLAALAMLSACGVPPRPSTGAPVDPNTPQPLCQADPYNTIYQNSRFTCDLEIQASPGNPSIPVYVVCSSDDHGVKWSAIQNTFAGALDGPAQLGQTNISGDAVINTEGLRGIAANMTQQFIDDIKAHDTPSPCSTPNARYYLNVSYNIGKGVFSNSALRLG
jgi:hypothetical protein